MSADRENRYLILKPFFLSPQVDFGQNVDLGKIVSAVLIVENQNDYDSTVRIIKFPKDKTVFWFEPTEIVTINPYEKAHFTFFWHPKLVGNIRETVRFRIDETFSLHAYLLGRAAENFVKHERKPFVPVQLTSTSRKNSHFEETFTLFESSSEVFKENFHCKIDKRQTYLIKQTKPTQKIFETNVESRQHCKEILGDDEPDLFSLESVESSSRTFSVCSLAENDKKVDVFEDETDENAKLFDPFRVGFRPVEAKIRTEREQLTNCDVVQKRQHNLRINSETETTKKFAGIRSDSKKRIHSAPNVVGSKNFIEKDEEILRLWLNAVLTPKVFETDVSCASKRKLSVKELLAAIDKQTAVALPASKEAVTSKMYSASRLMNDLRRRAFVLFKNLQTTMLNIEKAVEAGKIIVRKDKAIHADVGLKQFLLTLLFSVNPLWLRLGLETIYGEIIPLKNNNDRLGLTKFIVLRLFNDPTLLDRFGIASVRNYFKEGYGEAIGKFFLVKCLSLFLYLDKAKINRLIVHDPCLFVLNSGQKSIKDVLCALTKEILSGEGNLFKQLNFCGYIPEYCQTWLDETHMPVANLATDLRDGVRLARAYEILNGEFTLSSSLRGPPISRLQKLHNVELVLDKLTDLSPNLFRDFESKKIVGGHREETLDLIWKMRMHFEEKTEAVIKIQRWFRRVITSRRFVVRKTSAIKIQRWFRSIKRLKRQEITFNKQIFEEISIKRRISTQGEDFCDTPVLNLTAVIKIQAWARCALARRRFLRLKLVSIRIQRWYRGLKETSIRRRIFLKQIQTVIAIQRRGRILLEVKRIREELSHRRLAIVKIQSWFRRNSARKRFLLEKASAIRIQRSFRNLQEARMIRKSFLQQLNAVTTVQRNWRIILRSRKIREEISLKRNAIVRIQAWFRRNLARKQFLLEKASATKIQRWLRSLRVTWSIRKSYLKQMNAVTTIQRNWRIVLRTRKIREEISLKMNAIVRIQAWFRRNLARKQFLLEKASATKIQRWFRSLQETRSVRKLFLQQLKAVTTIQRNWRIVLYSRLIREEISLKRNAAATRIQAWFLRNLARKRFLQQRISAATRIQRWFLSLRETRSVRKSYLKQMNAITTIQRNWRIVLRSRKIREEISLKKISAIRIQSWFRRILLRKRFLFEISKRIQIFRCQIHAIKAIQAQGRVILEAKRIRSEILSRRLAAIRIQVWFRQNLAGKRFLLKKTSATTIQRWFRSLQETRSIRKRYLQELNALHSKKLDEDEITLKINSAIKIQTWFRRNSVRKNFLLEKMTSATSQNRIHVKEERYCLEILSRRLSAVKIQAWFRRNSARKRFLLKKTSATRIQRWFRSLQETRSVRKLFLQQLKAVTTIQRNWRIVLYSRLIREEISLKRNAAAIRIQAWFLRNLARKRFLQQRISAATRIQRWFLSLRETRSVRKRFLQQMNAITTIQRSWRNLLLTRKIHEEFMLKRKAAIRIQAWFRRHLIRKRFVLEKASTHRSEFLLEEIQLKNVSNETSANEQDCSTGPAVDVKSREELAAIKIQAVWRSFRQRKTLIHEELIVIRRRLTLVNREATQENTIEARTSLALDYLLNYNGLRYIELSMEHLEIVTKLSALSCTRLVDCGGMNIIHKIIIDMNQGIACARVTIRALSVVGNVAKYEVTREALLELQEWPSTLIRLLELNKDYNEDIFTKACIILIIMSKDFSGRMIPRLKCKLKSLCTTLVNRHELQVKKANEKFLKTSGIATTLKQRKQTLCVSSVDLFAPDWILCKDKPNEILTRLQAIQWVCKVYDV